MSERPVMFTDWRRLWQSELQNLGHEIRFQWRWEKRVRMTRELWTILHRLDRIKARLDVEFEVKDETWCMSMLQIISDYRREQQGDQ